MRLVLVVASLLLSAACSATERPDGTAVLAAAYPFAWAAEQVAGPDAEVTNLVDSGVEPHDLELTPRQVQALQSASVVVYLDGFQPAVDDAVRDLDAKARLDLGDVVDAQPLSSDLGDETGRGLDPHVWLDPLRMKAMVEEIGRRLAEADPEHADGYRRRAGEAGQSLTALHEELSTSLATCARREIVTAHTAFAYLADRYRLEQVGVAGLSPEGEPSPGRLAQVARYARSNGVTTIFFESLVDPKLAQTVAGEVGADTAVLDPIEGVAGGDDYLSVMRRNGAALVKALGCR